MVKLGFVVEGGSERILIESQAFKTWLQCHGLELSEPVIDAQGNGNFLKPDKLKSYLSLIERRNPAPEHVILLTDLDDAPCYTAVRSRIQAPEFVFVCIARKSLESWYLADSQAMSAWLNRIHYEPEPELVPGRPWDYLHELSKRYAGHGTGSSKISFSKKMLNSFHFSIERAAAHPSCPSAVYFLNKLLSLSQKSQQPEYSLECSEDSL
jgi:hypothetical protein